MKSILPQAYKLLCLASLLLLCSCSTVPKPSPLSGQKLFVAERDGWYFSPFAPAFVVEEAAKPYNLIGTPSARLHDGEEEVFVDPTHPTIYTRKTTFSTELGSYTNLTYRVHFEKVPATHLGWGKNVGLLLVVTLNQSGQPVLFTTLHTCGCYLAFVPTSYLPAEAYPAGWSRERQEVYGEDLPGMLDFGDVSVEQAKLVLLLRDGNHRVKDMYLADANSLYRYDRVMTPLKPMKLLEGLSLPGGGSTSFYDTDGGRQDYVKDSQKPWERLMMGWWALDMRVGEDKKLGRDFGDGIVFYTSLKPWARDDSDLRDFPTFLRYWGWGL